MCLYDLNLGENWRIVIDYPQSCRVYRLVQITPDAAPAVETQAEDCAHRIGQTHPVQVFAYLTPDSIEQRIGEILGEKRALFADIIDGVATASLRRLDLPTLLRAVGG